MRRFGAVFLLLGAGINCSRTPDVHPTVSASAASSALAMPNCIDETLVSGMFENIRRKTTWAIDGPMVWGYFFVDRDRGLLDKARDALERRGYRYVETLDPE